MAMVAQRRSQSLRAWAARPAHTRRPLLLAACVLLALGLDHALPPDMSRYHAVGTEILARDGETLALLPAAGGIWRTAPPQNLDRRYLALVLAAEDRNFFTHDGIDARALLRAAFQYARAGHIVSGGSTLSMQTARLLEPHPRSLIGKLHDLIRAVQLERRYTKQEILNIYLTLCPFGGNLEGVRIASLAYFGHEPDHLTAGEAAILAAIPQKPSLRRADRHGDRAVRAAAHLLNRLTIAGQLPAGFEIPSYPALGKRNPLPRRAGFLAAELARGNPPGARIVSTIDFATQRDLDALLLRQSADLPRETGLAAIILRNRTREILAIYGGRGMGFPGGSIDLTRARRSPGSALKPFVYGLAFDEGFLHPLTLIDDTEGAVDGYAPQNFDGQYHGVVTAARALSQSYNIPAVKVLDRLGAGKFAQSLRLAGATIDIPRGDKGLALALGGLGISPRDLAALYAALASDGQGRPLLSRRDRVIAAAPTESAAPFLGDLARHYVTEILQSSPPPPGRAYAEATGAQSIAFKTGTSFGFRDAWAAGYTNEATVVVWFGRVEGTPRPGYFGRNTAAPVMFDIFALLPPDHTPARPVPRDAILAERTEDLPLALRHLTLPHVQTAKPHISWPPRDAAIDLVLDASGHPAKLRLSADRGVPPFRWRVNGVPLPPSGERDGATFWLPDGPGFAHLRLTDGADHSVEETVRLVAPEG